VLCGQGSRVRRQLAVIQGGNGGRPALMAPARLSVERPGTEVYAVPSMLTLRAISTRSTQWDGALLLEGRDWQGVYGSNVSGRLQTSSPVLAGDHLFFFA